MSNGFPEALYVGESSLQPSEESWEQIKIDPRGVLLMFEPPRKDAKYVMGMDSSEGITGWSRATRVQGDHKTDNGAIEIFEIDGEKVPLWTTDENGNRVADLDPSTGRQRVRYRDVQVAEFAAPCDAVEIARVANVLGKIYRGSSEEQCLLIWESWPGCGMLATQELLRLDYRNLWQWETFADAQAAPTNSLGWHSSYQSQLILWTRARRHMMSRSALIRSRFLYDEWAKAEVDVAKMRAKASYGNHDDRFVASELAFWGGHAWTYDEYQQESVTETPQVLDYQRRAPGLEDYESFTDWRSRMVVGMED